MPFFGSVFFISIPALCRDFSFSPFSLCFRGGRFFAKKIRPQRGGWLGGEMRWISVGEFCCCFFVFVFCFSRALETIIIIL